MKLAHQNNPPPTDPADVATKEFVEEAVSDPLSDLIVTHTGSSAAIRVIGQAGSDKYTLIDAPTIATDCSNGNVFTVTLNANRILGTPTNAIAGFTYVWVIVQDGTGDRTLDVSNPIFKWPGGTEAVLTTGTPGAIDTFTAVYDGTGFLMTSNLAFS